MVAFRINSIPKVKKEFRTEHLINWYIGNYLDSPNNGIRDNSFEPDKDDWRPVWTADIENLKSELKSREMTHSDFLRLVKEKGIHEKYYLYRKYVSDCRICKA